MFFLTCIFLNNRLGLSEILKIGSTRDFALECPLGILSSLVEEGSLWHSRDIRF